MVIQLNLIIAISDVTRIVGFNAQKEVKSLIQYNSTLQKAQLKEILIQRASRILEIHKKCLDCVSYSFSKIKINISKRL